MVRLREARPASGHNSPSTSALESLRSTYSKASRMSRSVEGRFDSLLHEDHRFASQKRRQGAPSSPLLGKAESSSALHQRTQAWTSPSTLAENVPPMSGIGPPPGVPCLGNSSHPQSTGKVGLRWDSMHALRKDSPRASSESFFFPSQLSPQEPCPNTPPPKLFDALREGGQKDDITPPKDLDKNNASRRALLSSVRLPNEAQAPTRSKAHSWREPLSGNVNANISDMNVGPRVAEQRSREIYNQLADFDSLMAKLMRRQPSTGEVTKEIPIPCPQEKVPTPVSVGSRNEKPPPLRTAEGASNEESDSYDRRRLPEFGVTSPCYSRAMVSCSMDDLPTSLRNALMFVTNLHAFPCTRIEGCNPLLPPIRNDRPLRPTLVLDLDETLVHCSRNCSRSCSSRVTPSSIYNRDHLLVQFDDTSCGYVGFRPFVNTFLRIASKDFEIVVFTASQQSYADKVIDALDPGGNLIQHRLYRQHCTEHRGAFFKELHLLGRPVHKCILVDNSPISVACNWDNSILCKSWYDDPNDNELCDLLRVLREILSNGVSCDQYLAQRYGLRDFFQGLRAHARHAP